MAVSMPGEYFQGIFLLGLAYTVPALAKNETLTFTLTVVFVFVFLAFPLTFVFV